MLSAASAFGQNAGDETATNAPPASIPTLGLTTNETLQVAGPANPGTPGVPVAGTSQLFTPSAAGIGPSGAASPFRWGPVKLSPHLTYQVSYGNGVQASPGQQGNTLINEVSPGILLALGTHWTLDYTPALRFYSSKQFKDGTDHLVSLNGATTYQDWSFGLGQSYSLTSQPLVETGAQTDQETYSTALTAGYQFNSRMSLSLSAGQNFRFIDQTVATEALTNMREWTTLDWLNYHFNPSLEAGLGAGFTYDNLTGSPDMTSEQLLGRVSWKVGNRLRLLVNGGLNDQQFLTSGASDLLSPIFSVAAQYQLFEPTSFSLTASRSVSPSYLQGASSEVTGFNASLNQRLLKRFFLGVSGGYNTTDFHATTSGPVANNIDSYNTTSFSVSLSTVFFKRATASIFYQASYNSSKSALYNYDTTQSGLTLGYHF
ncbi:MAG TPA: hypothetical protein VFE51_20485 [Verrucomicrobiae bacterium]|nr:hypothetical protein [Verrucomicrobiae bacterium]